MTKQEFSNYQKKWMKENRPRIRANAKRCYEKNKERYRKLNGIKMKRERKQHRAAVLAYYGPKCNKCGYASDTRALHIDHINNDGWKTYRRSKNNQRTGMNLPRDLMKGKVNWEDFQILCANCNTIKAAEVIQHKAIEKYGETALREAGLL